MILVASFFLLAVVLSLLLIGNAMEKYTLLGRIGSNDNQSNFYFGEKKPTPRGGAKYNRDSDYFKVRQRRDISQIRTTGEDG